MKYNPHLPIDRDLWRALDEDEKIMAVRRYHRAKGIRLPSPQMHAVLHVVVENQVAHGDEYVAESVLLRLIGEGLSRHQAIHAIATVLAEQMFRAVHSQNAAKDLGSEYTARLTRLTAESWKKQFSEDDD